jgi:two-component system cell cycle sensor histidine kinase/response regulator CckA
MAVSSKSLSPPTLDHTTPAGAETAADNGHDPLLRQLAASLAHNVNNALTGVVGYLELALAQTPHESDLAAHLHSSLTCAFRAAAVVRQIVAFAAKPPTVETLTVLSLRDAAERALARYAEVLPFNVTAQVAGESHGWTQGNAALLDGALDQLLTNALEAMPDGGTLTLFLHEEGELCCLSVCDTGPGIAPDVVARLFEPFVTTKPSGHPGLGLALCRQLVQAQRGRLQVASLAGQGATITLSFPSLRMESERGTGS